MAGRISRSGKKFAGKHSSYTKMAGDLVSVLEKDPAVKKISAGIIKTHLPNLKGRKRVKIIDEGACLLLRIRGNISQQEVRIYSYDKAEVVLALRQYADVKNILLQQG